MSIEKLSPEERFELRSNAPEWLTAKAMSLIDALTAENERLRPYETSARGNAEHNVQLLAEVAQLRAALADKAHVLERYADTRTRLATATARLERVRQILFDTDQNPKPQWPMAREVNRITVAGKLIDDYFAGPKVPACACADRDRPCPVHTEEL